MSEIIEDQIRFPARDGYSLAGHVCAPRSPKAAVLISSGTGFPKEYYRRLARAGAERGFACLSYDYRGTAGSAPDDMAQCGFTIMDWARQDFPAALDRAEALAPDRPVFTLGHSVGGHLLGFADNALKPAAHAFICSGAGYWGAHDWRYRPVALSFWLVIGPLLLARRGYIASGGPWRGCALPAGVFKEWRRWAFKPRYFGDEFDQLGPHHFDDLRAPIQSYGFTDDTLASDRSQRDLLALYSAADKTLIRLEPAEAGAEKVGHDGAFRASASDFHPRPFEWFEQFLSA